MSLLQYRYYDTPEGQDIWKKTFTTTRYAAIAGLGFATFDVLMYSHPQGALNTLARYGYYMGPLVGMAAAFTVTTNMSQNFRGKNDKINYFLGGVAAGSIFGAWRKSVLKGFPAAMVLGVGAITKKMSIDEGWQFFPEIIMQTNSATSVRNDWTMGPDQPKGFTTGSEPLFPILSFPPPIPAPETSEQASAARLRSPPSRSARD